MGIETLKSLMDRHTPEEQRQAANRSEWAEVDKKERAEKKQANQATLKERVNKLAQFAGRVKKRLLEPDGILHIVDTPEQRYKALMEAQAAKTAAAAANVESQAGGIEAEGEKLEEQKQEVQAISRELQESSENIDPKEAMKEVAGMITRSGPAVKGGFGKIVQALESGYVPAELAEISIDTVSKVLKSHKWDKKNTAILKQVIKTIKDSPKEQGDDWVNPYAENKSPGEIDYSEQDTDAAEVLEPKQAPVLESKESTELAQPSFEALGKKLQNLKSPEVSGDLIVALLAGEKLNKQQLRETKSAAELLIRKTNPIHKKRALKKELTPLVEFLNSALGSKVKTLEFNPPKPTKEEPAELKKAA